MEKVHGLVGKPSNNKKDISESASARISIRCHPDIKLSITQKAKKANQSLSDYMVSSAIAAEG
tara:strand:+ start:118 stop:306 length:189 start_codon:yes stop_codon:yes gene_type:complete